MKWIASRRRSVELAFVLLIIAGAVCRRLEYLTERPFWVDESESSINALTILEHGVPSDRYLGIPIYENTLVKPWPGNPEYEFKDISYSDRGLATYHGWLPLYSIAASFALHGVAPDWVETGPAPHRTLEDFKRRTWIARLPSVFFSAVFLALCYWGGITMLGRDAGLTALLVGCVHQTQLDVATTARYYSATVTLSTAAVLCLWLILTKGQWKHYVIAAGVFTLLFYTHLVTFAAGILVFGTVAGYLAWKRRDSIPRLLMFGGLLMLATVPWIFASGFLSGLGSVPPARLLLSFPKDLLTFPIARPVYFIFVGAFLLAILCTRFRRFNIPARMQDPLRDCWPAVGLLSLWIGSGYACFMLFIPAASFFPERINLSYWGPAVLLGSVFCAGISRLFTKRLAVVAAPLLAFLLLGLTGHDLRGEPSPNDEQHSWSGLTTLAGYLDLIKMQPSTRLYASPNEHLNLMFYTGRPFQSIAPVRKSFLDSYRGDIVYVEPADFLPRAPILVPKPVKRSGGSWGAFEEEEATRVSCLWRTLPYRREVNAAIFGVADASDILLPVNATGAIFGEPAQPYKKSTSSQILMFRGYETGTLRNWWTVFFYRFIDPASRSGTHTNFAERLRGSTADLLTNADWAIYYSTFHARPAIATVDFRVWP